MGRAIGKKTPPHTEEARLAQSLGGQKNQGQAERGLNGLYSSPTDVRAALKASRGERLHKINQLTSSADERIRLDALKYLWDRDEGKPTEKMQVEAAPVSFIAPTDAQMGVLARKVTGGEDDVPVGEPEDVN